MTRISAASLLLTLSLSARGAIIAPEVGAGAASFKIAAVPTFSSPSFMMKAPDLAAAVAAMPAAPAAPQPEWRAENSIAAAVARNVEAAPASIASAIAPAAPRGATPAAAPAEKPPRFLDRMINNFYDYIGQYRLPSADDSAAASDAARFVQAHGDALRRVPGISAVGVRTTSVGDPYNGQTGWSHSVGVEVAPTADMKVVAGALEKYRYAGVGIQAMSKGWTVHETYSDGLQRTPTPLQPAMGVSLKGLEQEKGVDAFIRSHGFALAGVPGVIAIAKRVEPVGDPYNGQTGWAYSVVVEVSPSADMKTVGRALEAYRYAGVDIAVMSHGWTIREITRDGGVFERTPLRPIMALRP